MKLQEGINDYIMGIKNTHYWMDWREDLRLAFLFLMPSLTLIFFLCVAIVLGERVNTSAISLKKIHEPSPFTVKSQTPTTS